MTLPAVEQTEAGSCRRPLGLAFAAPTVASEDQEAVLRVLRSGWITTGVECQAFERELGDYLGAAHVVTVSSCTAAIEIASAYLRLPPGARVGVPTWTFVASAIPAVRTGGTPVLLDIDPDTLNVSPASLEAALSSSGGGLDALVAVHLGGVPVDPAVYALCEQAGVPVIEDAAHAFGATDHRGRIAGQGTVAACFSFYATKNLTSAEGGALVTEDKALHAFARAFRVHGLDRDGWSRETSTDSGYDCVAPGIKANLPDLLAALGRSQLARFDASQAHRRSLVERYRRALSKIDGVQPVPAKPYLGAADHLMIVMLPSGVDRSAVVADLDARGIGTSVHFKPLHQLSWFRKNGEIGPSGLATADALAPRALSLPLHVGLDLEDVDRTCDALATALNS